MKFFAAIYSAGIDHHDDPDIKDGVIITNMTAFWIGALIVIITPAIVGATGWTQVILPVSVDCVTAWSMILLNKRGYYIAASMGILILQSFFVLYFGYLLGEFLQLQFMLLFLFALVFRMFPSSRLRKIGFGIVATAMISLQFIYYHNRVPLVSESMYGPAHLSQFLAIVSTMFLILKLFQNSLKKMDLSQKLEADVSLKSNYIAKISHEVRTPLNAVYGSAQLLQQALAAENPDLALCREYAASVVSGCENATSVISDIMEFTSLNYGPKSTPESRPVVIEELNTKIIQIYKHPAAARGLDIEVHTENMPPCILTDPTKLQTIINNLVGNAIKYANSNTLIHIRLIGMGDYFYFSIQNSATKISNEKLNQLFTPWTRGSSNSEGTGLGLAIVRQTVEDMDGSINARYQEGSYIFTVHLPLVAAATFEPSHPATYPERNLAGVRVLLVDDNQMNCLLIKRFLTGCGCLVDARESGRAALAALRDNEYDCIILDYVMPDMNGLETIKAIKQNFPSLNIPIIAASGDLPAKNILLQAGAADFVEKPISLPVLEEIISQNLPVFT